MIKLHRGDCLEYMKQIPDNSVDMILCDLPYGVTAHKSDVVIPFDKLWKEYLRITKSTTPILLFSQGTFFVDLVNSNRKMYRYDLIWDKRLVTGFLNAKRMPLRQHEQIAVFYRNSPVYNPQFTEGEPIHSRGEKYLIKGVTNNDYGGYKPKEDDRKGTTERYPTSILMFQKPHPSVALHRTEKPIALLEWLIKTYSNTGDTILDNCMGSGTTGVAAVNTDRNFIGCEIDKEYYKIAKKRIKEAKDNR